MMNTFTETESAKKVNATMSDEIEVSSRNITLSREACQSRSKESPFDIEGVESQVERSDILQAVEDTRTR